MPVSKVLRTCDVGRDMIETVSFGPFQGNLKLINTLCQLCFLLVVVFFGSKGL